MNRITLACIVSALITPIAMADMTIGVTQAFGNHLFLTNVRNAMEEQAATYSDVTLQFEDAQGDIGRQLNHIQNFISADLDAMIVSAVDTAATPRMISLAQEANIPLVFVNREPEIDNLPEGVAFVGSDENDSGRLQIEEIARLLNYKGNVAIMVGELGINATVLRTKGVEDFVGQHPDMHIVAKQPAHFMRNDAIDLMNNWIVDGRQIDAIAANNDEMAIGAIRAMHQAGLDPQNMIIGGIDASGDALMEMENGNLDVTVFQDAKGQGRESVKTAVSLIQGEHVDSYVWLPFQLVTPDNYKDFIDQ